MENTILRRGGINGQHRRSAQMLSCPFFISSVYFPLAVLDLAMP